MKVPVVLILLLSVAYATSAHDQILALLQTGTKANDAIDAVFGLLGDLVQSNDDAQYAADEKNKTDEWIGEKSVESFTKIMSLNKKLFTQSIANREFFEAALHDAKDYIAWNELRQDDIHRKIQVLLDNQCFSNQLFVRSIKMNQEAVQVVKLLESDVAGYVINGDSFELVQVKSISDKLRGYSQVFNAHEISSFLALANTQEGEQQESHSGGTLAERVLGVLQGLSKNLEESLDNLQQNEIAASWELAGWVSLSEAEVDSLAVEKSRKETFADRTATQISAALAQQAKSKIILQESQDALDQILADLQEKRDSYADAKAKRDEENVILGEVISMFKKQVASWSGR